MIDTHCHLTDPRLAEQLAGVLARASAVGVERMVTVGTHPQDWPGVIALAERHANVRCAVGVHPNNCQEATLEDVARLRELQKHPGVAALGEMGLDYHYDTPRDMQRRFFEAQLQIAGELDRPVIVHSRESVADCLAVMRGFPGLLAVFHCFTGSAEEARQILDAGYWLGFTGVVTFRNGTGVRGVAATTPADRILVETDAPYLSPEPMRRQKINEPALVVHTAAAIAAARGMAGEEFDALTSANARRFYRWE